MVSCGVVYQGVLVQNICQYVCNIPLVACMNRIYTRVQSEIFCLCVFFTGLQVSFAREQPETWSVLALG